jgi:pseudouridine synthase
MPSYFVLNKPADCISTRSDPRHRSTVYDHVPSRYPALPHVGRLDYNTEGLLLFTDDGRLAQALLNPEFAPGADGGARPVIEKIYNVKVQGLLDPADPRIAALEAPLDHPDGVTTRPARARFLELRSSATWIEVVLTDGRTRQVRLLCARSGFLVVKLRRVAIGPLRLDGLKLRWCRPLTREEVAACYALALPGEAPPPFVPIDDPLATSS